MDAQVQSIEKKAGYLRFGSLEHKLVRLASLVQVRGIGWALVVPTDPLDREWLIRLGCVEVVAEDLETALDLAIDELLRSLSS